MNKDYLINDVDLFLNTSGQLLKCELCRQEISDQFIRCQHCYDMDAEPFYFHTSCAYFARLTLEYRDFPTLLVGACPCHVKGQNNELELKVGERVVFYAAQKRIEMVQILESSSFDYCYIDFLDSTFSEDVSLKEIVDCECKQIDCNGRHVPGWLVTVCWEDSKFQV